MSDYRIEQVRDDDSALIESQQLLQQVFSEHADKFSFEYLKWQYADNTAGPAVGFNAYAGEVLAAHYVTTPIYMILNGQRVPGLLSLNTATHPDYRGKRLFTLLAERTYEYATEKGYQFVIGVANANSTHGFLKHLGFYLVAPLEVKVGVGDPYRFDVPSEKNRVAYDEATLKWRLSCPVFQYSSAGKSIYGRIGIPLFHTAVGKLPDGITRKQLGLKKTFDVFNLYIGLGLDKVPGLYAPLPKFIKRSPFNLIFKDLTGGKLPILTKDNVFFQLLDFDVA
jgi:GNAT superfamily N-acetyltransferase